MIVYKRKPAIEDGIGIINDTPKAIKQIVSAMLGNQSLEDKYLFIVDINPERFREYYILVLKRCDEINELIEQNSDIKVGGNKKDVLIIPQFYPFRDKTGVLFTFTARILEQRKSKVTYGQRKTETSIKHCRTPL